ncbi:sorbitol dehydrogenase [Candidatus Magnetobacterium bavaricum]|uniref:Sorbitol dehydrogenase n=1 Tax=Candidatus Magnetobacterium bavaricum TaxID=29290 RepID=A0A0F3H3Q8_9BACT|nr:sorbitol dehydrogenase [Candidatus Magnetobacterium bavaricum]
MADGQWLPRTDYTASAVERQQRRAVIGSKVWRNPTFEVRDVPVPEIDDDELLIRVVSCGICGSDLHLYEQDNDGYVLFSGPVRLPCIIGHEYTGVVERVGRRVSNFRTGRKVAVESIYWCGVCTACKSGAFNQCKSVELVGITRDGAMAEFVAAKERHCWDIDCLDQRYQGQELFDVGALIEPIGCAYNGIFVSGGGFKPGATVVVYGVGPIGLAAVALSRLAGANLIIAFDCIDTRLDIAATLGADYTFNINTLAKNSVTAAEQVMALTNGGGAEVQVEAAGAAAYTFAQMQQSIATSGKIIYLGRAASTATLTLDRLVTEANSIIGSRGHSGAGVFHYVIRLLASGRLNVGEIITARYPFKDVLSAFQKSTDRHDGKCMIAIS